MRARGVALVACMALVNACSEPVATIGPGPVVTAGPTGGPSSDAPAPGNSGVIPGTATLEEMNALAAADDRAMRTETGFPAAVGADGNAVLDYIETERAKFAQAFFARMLAEFGAEPAVAAASGVELARYAGPPAGRTTPPTAREAFNPVSLTDQVTGYVAVAGLLIPVSDRVLTGVKDETTTTKGKVGSADVEQTSKVRLDLNMGQGLLELLIQLESSTKTSQGGAVAGILNGTGSSKVKINSCPDATGHVKGEVDMTVSELTSAGGATSSSDTAVHATFTLSVSPSATLVSLQADITTSGGGIGAGSSWTAGGTSSLGGGAEATSTSNGATDEQVTRVNRNGAVYAAWAIGAIAVQAEEFWRSGKCVDMNASIDSKKVAPKEKVTFTVAPRGKWDSQPIDADVSVRFEGKESSDPSSGSHKPPVSITYTAGEKKDDKGSVHLEQTSMRGIGRKSITFTVGDSDYRVGQGGMTYVYSGTKCKGLAGPWTLNINVGGGMGTVTFTIPENLGAAVAATSYKLSIAGTSNVFNLTGTVTPKTDAEGKVTLVFALGSGTLTQQHPDGSITLSFSDPTVDNIALETGSFCGTT